MSQQSIQLGFPQLPQAGSPLHTSVLAKWIHSCDRTHACHHNANTFFPTRIIDVGKNGSSTVQLLYDTRALSGTCNYLALSHRWGDPGKHQAFRTLKKDIISGQTKRTIDITDLPKTFWHAIRITRSLEVTYLWVDSLCIVQDDADDWRKEFKLMEQVFSSAYCTIAATCASGTDDGFLKPRPERRYVTMALPGIDAFCYLCEAIDDFSKDVDQSNLNSRAWVLQERALSRRTIHFTRTQSYWECGRGVRCETLTMMTK